MTATTRPAVAPSEHTMGERLADYVLPKVPTERLTATGGRAWGYPNRGLSFLQGGQKRQGKRFNWRRPYFTQVGDVLHCVAPPGYDYIHHYAELLRSACLMAEIPGDQVDFEMPAEGRGRAFVDHWLPTDLPTAELVVLGYVDALWKNRGEWTHRPGFGWRTVRVGSATVLMLGCEFSFWGDLAGDLVSVLAQRARAAGVVYVGKLGGLQPDMVPNTLVVTGTTTRLRDRPLAWNSFLDLRQAPASVRSGVRHATLASVMDETRTWLDTHRADTDVVDPEIGHMAQAATEAGVGFAYLHIVTDNLNGTHAHGLYAERSTPVATRRHRCLHDIETVLNRSLT